MDMFQAKKVAVKIVKRLYVDFAETRLSPEAIILLICLVTYKIIPLRNTWMQPKWIH